MTRAEPRATIDRRRSRILAMQALCQYDVLEGDFDAQLQEFLMDEGDPVGVRLYAAELVGDVRKNQADIDARIQAHAPNWAVARMAIVDRNILRVAACELLHRPDLPPRVAIDEALEIAKSFGSAESGAFVNGVLDAIYKDLRNAECGMGNDEDPRTSNPQSEIQNPQ